MLGVPVIAANGAQQKDVITHGQTVDISKHLVRGKVTIVEFYADWCGPCRLIAPMLEQLAKDPKIAIRRIDIVNWESPVAHQYNINAIPHVLVYNRKRQLVGVVAGVDPEGIQQTVAKAKDG